jgi:hypothetical protein
MTENMERMLEELDAQDRMPRKRRIIGDIMCSDESDAEVIMASIRERLSSFGADSKIKRRDVKVGENSERKVWVFIDVWCDARPGTIEELALRGFQQILDLVVRNAHVRGAVDNVDNVDFEPSIFKD